MMMMTPMWVTLLKVLVVFLALFTSYEAKDYDGIIKDLFKITNDEGVVLFNNVSAEVQSDQPQHLQRHPSDTTYRPPLTPPQPLVNATNRLKPCRNNSSDQLKTFCTEVDDYPNLSKFKVKLEQTYAKFFMNNAQPTDVSSRVGGDPDEMYLCKSNRRLIFPKKGQKSDNTWQLIVNDEEYKQGIQIEECEGDGKPCDFASNFPQHYRPICKQHYIQQTLVSIQGDDVGQGSFKIPSCCKCALKIL
ncbi:protein spaetzle isoform X13 [Drosophila suzukii]|uniref:Protein spaetzle isoform X13 n=1 Tax=Drosophila suzukii TaxID=28584 RepID=A0AB40ABW4_DROSZ